MLRETKKRVMEDHVSFLCELHGLQHALVTNINASEAWIEFKTFWAPPITGMVPYYVALHEIGHFQAPNKWTTLGREGFAWYWAIDNAKFKTNKSVCNFVIASLDKYLDISNNDKRYRMPAEQNNLFWKVYDDCKEKLALNT